MKIIQGAHCLVVIVILTNDAYYALKQNFIDSL